MSKQDMCGRVAFVAGGAGGIGGAICRAFAARGADVVVADISKRRGAALVEAIVEVGGQARFVGLDAADAAAWDRAVDQAGAQVDFLVTSFFSGQAGSIDDMQPDQWDACFRGTAAGVYLAMRAIAPRIPRGGAIVNIASVAAHVPSPQNIGYSAAKAAVVNLSRSVALGLAGRGVRVNVVTPGMIRTRALEATMAALSARGEVWTGGAPLGDVGEPNDIAEAVTYLCSDAARYITGAELVVDGGLGLAAH